MTVDDDIGAMMMEVARFAKNASTLAELLVRPEPLINAKELQALLDELQSDEDGRGLPK